MPPKACKFGFKPCADRWKKDKCSFCGLTEPEHNPSGGGGGEGAAASASVASTPASVVSTPAPVVSPVVSTPAPVVSTPAPVAPTPDPVVSTPAPVVSTPAPAVVSTPAPAVVSTPAPAVASTPAPSASIPATPEKPVSPSPSPSPAPSSGKKACKFGYKPNPNKYKKDSCATCGLSEAAHASVMEALAIQRAKEEEDARIWAEEARVKREKDEAEAKVRRGIQEEEKRKKDEEMREMMKAIEEREKKEAEEEARVWKAYEDAVARGENPVPPKRKMLKQYQILDWAISVAARFGVKVTGFENSSWKSGLAFAALIANFRPDLIDIASLNPSEGLKNCRMAFDAAGKLGFNSLLDAEDVEHADYKSIATQVFHLYRYVWELIPIKDPVPQAKS